MKKISLITPVLNAEAMLRRSLESVLRQDYPYIEHVVADGGSQDGTVQLLKDYEKKYSETGKKLIWVSEKDKGMIDATNKASRMATGELFLFFSDVYVNDHVISNIVAAFDNNEIDYIHGGLIYQRDGRVIRTWKGKHGNWRLGWMAAHPTLCFTRSVWKKHGPYVDKYLNSWDYDFEIKLFKDRALKYKTFEEPLVIYYAGGTSNGSLSGKCKSIRDAYFVLKDNHVRFAFFTNFCKTVRGVCSYLFVDRKEIKLEQWMG